MSRRDRIFPMALCLGAAASLLASTAWAQVKIEDVLAYKPTQKDVDIDMPAAAEIPNCKLEVERGDGSSGWALFNPQGQILRRFMDTNGDRGVDEFRYYKHGLEVYRDMDTNANNEVDQFRWLNTAGTRWGVDTDGDRKIDVWKMISAEEATREAILALASKDERRLLAVMLTPEDLKSLGLASEPASRLAANIKDAPQRFRTVLSLSKIITPKTQWVRFDCSMLMPSLIPAEPGKTRNDLTVYENVMAIVDNGGENGFVQVGEMVRVGQAWKLTQVPQPMEGEKFELAEGGILLQPAAMGAATAAEGLSPKLKELLDQLRELDAKAPQAQAKLEDITKYNVARAQLLALLTDESPSDEEKLMWQRQRLEGIAAATQMKTYPNGVEELKRSEQALRRAKVDENLVAFAVFQRLLAEYNLQLETATSQEDRGKLQESWLKSLEGFVSEFPKAPESADAMLQLAITYEFNGNLPQASSWYNKLATGYPKSAAAARAQGALRRLDLKGKPLKLSGASLAGGSTIDMAAYRGKVVAVIFWATWCTPCTQDLPQIQQLHKTYQKDGFEVLGVNLDGPGAPIQQYLQNFKVTWPHIHEEGGLESRPAVEFGVISLPTMFLIDRSGLVVSPSLSTEELVKQVPELLKK